MRALFLLPALALTAACDDYHPRTLEPVALQFAAGSSGEYGYCAALLERARAYPELLGVLPPEAPYFDAAGLIARAPSPSSARNTYGITVQYGLPVLTSPVIVKPELIQASYEEAVLTCAARFLPPAPEGPATPPT